MNQEKSHRLPLCGRHAVTPGAGVPVWKQRLGMACVGRYGKEVLYRCQGLAYGQNFLSDISFGLAGAGERKRVTEYFLWVSEGQFCVHTEHETRNITASTLVHYEELYPISAQDSF